MSSGVSPFWASASQEDIRRTLAVADQVLGEMERGER